MKWDYSSPRSSGAHYLTRYSLQGCLKFTGFYPIRCVPIPSRGPNIGVSGGVVTLHICRILSLGFRRISSCPGDEMYADNLGFEKCFSLVL